jgi:Bacterial HORMA domain family 1
MSFSMTRAVVDSFTLTQAKYLASKVTADMRRCQQLYDEPSDAHINNLGTELALLLRDGYVKSYEFGFVRYADDERILTWKYSVDSSGYITSDDRPGRIGNDFSDVPHQIGCLGRTVFRSKGSN